MERYFTTHGIIDYMVYACYAIPPPKILVKSNACLVLYMHTYHFVH